MPFYEIIDTKAARTPEAAKFFAELAAWEAEHVNLFKQLRKELKDSTTYVEAKSEYDLPASLRSAAGAFPGIGPAQGLFRRPLLPCRRSRTAVRRVRYRGAGIRPGVSR